MQIRTLGPAMLFELADGEAEKLLIQGGTTFIYLVQCLYNQS